MKFDKEISHPTHPTHKLKPEHTETPFRCDACNEAGIGLKYSCARCEFDLHKACASARPVTTHPFYPKCEFRLHPRPPGRAPRACDACRDRVTGLAYHCARCGFDLHPCCAALPRALHDGERALHLRRELAGPCRRCGGRRGGGWAYRSECGAYSLHVACVKELLVESWEALCLEVDEGRAREIRTRIPSLPPAMNGGGGRRVRRGWEIAGGAVRVVVSAILGDPTALIGAVVGGFMAAK